MDTEQQLDELTVSCQRWLTSGRARHLWEHICTQAANADQPDFIRVQVDVTELADEYPDIAEAVLSNIDRVKEAFLELMHLNEVHLKTWQRLWLCITSIPIPLETVHEIRKRAAPVSFHGICMSVASNSQHLFSVRVTCNACEICADVSEAAFNFFCLGHKQTCSGQIEEDVTERVHMPMQKIWVMSASAAFGVTTAVLVVLLDGHMCSLVRLGDHVHVIGHASVCTNAPEQPALPHLNQLKVCRFMPSMEAELSLVVASSVQLMPLSAVQLCTTQHALHAAQPALLDEQHLLSSASDALAVLLERPVPSQLLLALLLSAVNVGQTHSSIPGIYDKPCRMQVHVMVQSSSYDPGLVRTLLHAAGLLSPQSLRYSPGSHGLLPCASATAPASNAWRVDAGALALSSQGILVLDVNDLTKKERGLLAAAIDKGVLHHGKPALPELDVPVTSTVWATSSTDQMRSSKQKQPCGSSLASLPPALLPIVDLIVRGQHDGGQEEDMADIEYVFEQGGGDEEAGSLHHIAWALQQHITAARLLPPPAMTEGASQLLQEYYLNLRQSSGSVFADRSVNISTMCSLARLAAASALLHHRAAILPFPDAVLAIKLLDETLALKEGGLFFSGASDSEHRHEVGCNKVDKELQLFHTCLLKGLGHADFANNEE